MCLENFGEVAKDVQYDYRFPESSAESSLAVFPYFIKQFQGDALNCGGNSSLQLR